MTADDRIPPSQTDRIVLEFDLPHSPEKVWRALTEPELLTDWLLPIADLELEPGASFQFNAPPQPGWDGIVNCQLVEITSLKRISYQWVVGDLKTIVTFTLTPSASGTRLSLVHSGFKPDQKQNFAGARYGWKMMGGKLVDLLAGIP